jgi:hypothetical protein
LNFLYIGAIIVDAQEFFFFQNLSITALGDAANQLKASQSGNNGTAFSFLE